ncbi:hypothetical protein ABGB18_28135 [Nonomuraea sp. B12E4]|uniref:hypothetical protein n=1 Tax=Nonomuraea sp. B12E4 TaxID=3153564 RepID=UPI00325E04EA
MPELKSVIAGLAISTAMTGGVVGLGAATTAAGAATQVSAGTSILTDDGWDSGDDFVGDDFGHRRNRGFGFGDQGGFGWGGWGGRCRGQGGGGFRNGRHGSVCLNVTNDNFNDTWDDRRDYRRDDRREHDKFRVKDERRRDERRVVKPHHDHP